MLCAISMRRHMSRNIFIAFILCFILPSCADILGVDEVLIPADEEMSLCGNGVLEPGEICDDGNQVSGDGCSAECRTDVDAGTVIVDAGMVIECGAGTCTAGACESARCEDGACVVESICGPDEECCGGTCVAAGCDDENPCTADSCGQFGCEHAPADGAACDDGDYCNGTDMCVNGVCEEHAGDPCVAPTICDESQSACVGCLESSDCPTPEASEWSDCDDFEGVCENVGTTSRTVTVFSCENNICVGETQTETESCERDTEGITCGEQISTPWSECDGFDSVCDNVGTTSRIVTVQTCQNNTCVSETLSETESCERDTDGITCDEQTSTPWSDCDGFVAVCDSSGTMSRTVTTHTCQNNTCVSEPLSQTDSCQRVTEGVICGEQTTGPWSDCDGFDDVCDSSGTMSRTVTVETCQSDACVGESQTETDSCERDTDGVSCGGMTTSPWSDCEGIDGVCDSSGIRSRTVTMFSCDNNTCVADTQTQTESCERDPEGLTCDEQAVGSWSACEGVDGFCDNSGTRSRTVTTFACENDACVADIQTQTENCERDPEGLSCGEQTTTPWSTCEGVDGFCDSSGTRSRSITVETCQNEVCVGETQGETESCERDTEGVSCGEQTTGPWSDCGGFDGGVCDSSGTRSRTIMVETCQNDACVGETQTETDSCERDTDGNTCGEQIITPWSACSGFNNVCDSSGTRSRTVTVFSCDNNTCVAETETQTESCERVTEGVSCGEGTTGEWSDCGGFDGGVCDSSGTRSRTITMQTCQNDACVADTQTQTESCERVTEGNTCGEQVISDWSDCSGFDGVCGEEGTTSRTTTTFSCENNTCVADIQTETDSCERNTDWVMCDETTTPWSTCQPINGTCDHNGMHERIVTIHNCYEGTCEAMQTFDETVACSRDPQGDYCGQAIEDWGPCGGYSSTCDQSGTQSGTVTTYECGASDESCVGSSTSQTRSCSRNTNGNSCGPSDCSWSDCVVPGPAHCVGSQTRTCTQSLCNSGSCNEDEIIETFTCYAACSGNDACDIGEGVCCNPDEDVDCCDPPTDCLMPQSPRNNEVRQSVRADPAR